MYTIKTPSTHDEFKAYYALRYKVLSEPWGHPKGTEKDDFEPISEHFMAVNEKGEAVGVVKMYERSEGVGYFSHLAVASDHRNQGIGQLLLKAMELRARARGFRTLGTMERVTDTAYLEKCGFRIAGMPSPHLGTTHLVWLEKALT
jgi:N-acetylglutamate synthase-like GNAT family acetyltransferase